MFRPSSTAALSIAIAIGLVCVAILVGRGIAICFADKSDNGSAIVRQTPVLISTAEGQQNMLNTSNTPAKATRYFEPFLLLVLGATLLAIGTSIKRIAGAKSKLHLPPGRSKPVL